MEVFLGKIEQLPHELIFVVIFLMFLLQLVSKILDWLSAADRRKADGGVSHIAIYEKLGEQHGLLESVAKQVDYIEKSMGKLENDFRLHTQSDSDLANLFLRKLDDLNKKVEGIQN